MSVSEAERKRQERRQRILNNREERLKKILGSNSSFERSPLTTLSAESNWLEDINRESSIYDRGEEEESKIGDIGKEQNSSKNLPFDNGTEKESQFVTSLGKNRKEQTTQLNSKIKTTLDDKENIKIPTKYHHVLLCLLSLLLATFSGGYFLIYFVMYEFTVFVLNGYAFSSFYSTKNSSLLTLSILFGVGEVHRNRFQKLTFIINWLSVDLTIFTSSALLAALLYQLV